MKPTQLLELLIEVATKTEKQTASDILNRLAKCKSTMHWDIKALADEYEIELEDN